MYKLQVYQNMRNSFCSGIPLDYLIHSFKMAQIKK